MSVSDCSRFCMVIHDRFRSFLVVPIGKKTYSKGDEISCWNLRDSDAAICKWILGCYDGVSCI